MVAQSAKNRQIWSDWYIHIGTYQGKMEKTRILFEMSLLWNCSEDVVNISTKIVYFWASEN